MLQQLSSAGSLCRGRSLTASCMAVTAGAVPLGRSQSWLGRVVVNSLLLVLPSPGGPLAQRYQQLTNHLLSLSLNWSLAT